MGVRLGSIIGGLYRIPDTDSEDWRDSRGRISTIKSS